jgi:TIR domain
MPTIVISYRRSDSSAIAGRIFDRLTVHFGEDSVFMDVDNIPIGIDFRSHIHEALQRTDVVIAVIGPNWLGINADGLARMQEKMDPVRVEIETALQHETPIIPVLVEGAKMPTSSQLPPEFGNFAFLNAAEVATGRDFRAHMDRLIGAIDRAVAGDANVATQGSRTGKTRAAVARTEDSAAKPWLAAVLHYFIIPLALLIAAHHLIINEFDLRTEYLWMACIVAPFLSGFALLWFARRGPGPAFAFAIALGIIGVIAMTVSESLNSGDPLMPQTRYEWWDNINFAVAIALSFLAGHALARAARALHNRKFGKS